MLKLALRHHWGPGAASVHPDSSVAVLGFSRSNTHFDAQQSVIQSYSNVLIYVAIKDLSSLSTYLLISADKKIYLVGV